MMDCDVINCKFSKIYDLTLINLRFCAHCGFYYCFKHKYLHLSDCEKIREPYIDPFEFKRLICNLRKNKNMKPKLLQFTSYNNMHNLLYRIRGYGFVYYFKTTIIKTMGDEARKIKFIEVFKTNHVKNILITIFIPDIANIISNYYYTLCNVDT